jgi:hypothetical protein
MGSGVTALGFWGCVIDIAQKYAIFQLNDILNPDPILWLFLAVFIVGLVAMGAAAAGFVAKRGLGS